MTTNFNSDERLSPTSSTSARSLAPPSFGRLTPFVGRGNELAALGERLDAAERGDGGVIFIRGEPGIGKSRLLDEFATRSRAGGWLILSGRAYDMEGMPPYLPFIEVLREQLRHASDDSFAELASGAPELCALLPEVRARVPEPLQMPALGPEAERFRLFEAVAGFLIGIARQAETKGLLVVLDDLHWADRTSVLLLQHMSRQLGGVPLLIAAAYRSTEIEHDHPLAGVGADLTRGHDGKQMAVPPLTADETAMLIESLAGTIADRALALSIHDETSGNPFFVEELVRHLLERDSTLSVASAAVNGIPEGVRQVINQRLARLRPSTNAALQTAAVLGDSFSFGLLSAASELDERALMEAVEEAERAGMIREQGDGYTFVHGLIRRNIYDDLSLPRRQRNHLRAAEAMDPIEFGDLEAGRAVVAHHWRLSGHPRRATKYLLRAGDAALSLTAWEEAARLWEFALECMEKTGEPAARRARLLEGLGDLYFLSSFEAHPSVERYLQAALLYEGEGDHVSWARAKARAGRSLAYPTSGFDYAAALEHLHAAEAVLANEPESVELGELYAAMAHSESHALLHGPEEMLAAMRLVGETATRLEDEFLRDFLTIQCDHLEGHYLGLQGHLAEGLAKEELASEKAVALRDKPGAISQFPEKWHEFLFFYSSDDDSRAANNTGSMQLSRVSSRAGLANLTTGCSGWQMLDLNDPVSARAKHQRTRDPQGRILAPFFPYDLFLSGDLDALRRHVEAGSTVLSPLSNSTGIARTMLAWGEGRFSEVQKGIKVGAGGAEQWRKAGSRAVLVFANRWLLRLSRNIGDLDAAESILEESLAVSLTSGAVKYEFFARAELALLLAETGRPAEADSHLARCREIMAGGENWRGLGGRLSLAEAVAAAAAGRNADAEAWFQRALWVFNDLSLPWDEAEAFELWARACRRFHRGAGRRAFIAEKLSAARAVYERIGAGQPWLDRLDVEAGRLAAGGGHAKGEPLPDGLTAREGEVLRLVAAGRSSREIGSDLVLSVRTVERHVANIYLKTGTHGRVQLTTYAVARGLGPAQA